MRTILPKIKYKLYGVGPTDNPLSAESYYPIPATPEFDTYLEAKDFYDSTVAINENFYQVRTSEPGNLGFFVEVVIAKTYVILPHVNEDSNPPTTYSLEPYTWDEQEQPNYGLRTQPSITNDNDI